MNDYILGGVHADHGLCTFNGTHWSPVFFHQGSTPEQIATTPQRPRRWKTRSGITRFIAAEKAAGSDWTYVIIPVLRATAGPAAAAIAQHISA
jgi:hypothetical protein